MKSSIALSLVLLVFTACTNTVTERVTKKSPNQNVVTDDLMKDVSDNSLRADKLVAAAEPLISPVGFFYADEILAEALKADPENRKAQFYRALLAPAMKFRGFMNRATGNGANPDLDAQNFASIYYSAQGGLHDFLWERGEPFRNEADLQAFATEVLLEQKKLSDFLRVNKNMVTKITVPLWQSYALMIERCSVEKISDKTFHISPCQYLNQPNLIANRADWEALAGYWGGIRLATAITVSYDGSGLLDFAKHDRQSSFTNEKMLWDYLLNIKGPLGRLKSNHHLNDAMAMGTDLYGGFRALISMQKNMCPPGAARNHALEPTLCLKNQYPVGRAKLSTQNMLEVLNLSLSAMGGDVRLVNPLIGASGKSFDKINMDVMAPFKSFITDLHSLRPDGFDRCKNVNHFADPKLGGILPNADANEVMVEKRFVGGGCEL